jgi:hypothetical protein
MTYRYYRWNSGTTGSSHLHNLARAAEQAGTTGGELLVLPVHAENTIYFLSACECSVSLKRIYIIDKSTSNHI